MPPSTIVLLDNILAVLRRSPAMVEHQYEGRHRAECVLELGGAVLSVLDWSGREDIRLHQPCCSKLPLSVYEGTWTTLSPLVAMHHHDLVCA